MSLCQISPGPRDHMLWFPTQMISSSIPCLIFQTVALATPYSLSLALSLSVSVCLSACLSLSLTLSLSLRTRKSCIPIVLLLMTPYFPPRPLIRICPCLSLLMYRTFCLDSITRFRLLRSHHVCRLSSVPLHTEVLCCSV